MMNKNTFTAVKLAKGEMNVYDFGAVILIFNQPIGNLDSYNFVIRRQPNLSGESLTAFGFLC